MGDSRVFTGGALEDAVITADVRERIGGYGDVRDYNEWEVSAGDCRVKIEQGAYYRGESRSDLANGHEMSYAYFTDAQLNERMQEKRADQEALDGDAEPRAGSGENGRRSFLNGRTPIWNFRGFICEKRYIYETEQDIDLHDCSCLRSFFCQW